MLFNSYEFLVFFLPVGLVLFGLSRRLTWPDAPIYVLLALSIAFYTRHLGSFWYVLFLSIVANFALGRALADRHGCGKHHQAKLYLVAGIIGNLLVLAYFKYAYVVAISLGLTQAMSAPVALPLGISFYTFTQIAYLVDLYQGKARTGKFGKYALFVTYFPHLIAGPIIHHKDVMPQFDQLEQLQLKSDRKAILKLKTPLAFSVWRTSAAADDALAARRPSSDNYFLFGSALFTIGLFKKCVIADSFSPIVATVFDTASNIHNFDECWLASLSYTMQIYFDFSAYSDMALGISALFGIFLPVNFWSPYQATSIIDFWRRWHISLSTFLRDYVYIPLGGNRAGSTRRYLNVFITMLIGGIWHGAGLTFVIWGALHGGFILINHAWRASPLARFRPKRGGPVGLLAFVSSWAVTFLAVLMAWIFFRSPDVATAWRVLFGMADPMVRSKADHVGEWTVVAAACLIAWTCPNAYEITGWSMQRRGMIKDVPVGGRLRTSAAYPIALGLLLAIAIMFVQRQSEFLYWQF